MSTKKPTGSSPRNKTNWIQLSDFEPLCFNLARELMTFSEPIPDFGTRNPGVLESCLETPLVQFEGKDLYSSFEDKLSALFYLMIKTIHFKMEIKE